MLPILLLVLATRRALVRSTVAATALTTPTSTTSVVVVLVTAGRVLGRRALLPLLVGRTRALAGVDGACTVVTTMPLVMMTAATTLVTAVMLTASTISDVTRHNVGVHNAAFTSYVREHTGNPGSSE